MSVDWFIRSPILLLAALACLPVQLSAQDGDAPRTLSFSCGESLALDLKSNKSVCTMLRISDGEIEISADEGTANETDFESSVWQLNSNVRMSFDSAVMLAASAMFEFSENELVYAEFNGTPVEITDFIAEQNAEVRGTSQRIVYDSRTSLLQMFNQSEIVLGSNEYVGCNLTYNLTDKTFNFGSSDCGVTVRIYPDEDEDEVADAIPEQP